MINYKIREIACNDCDLKCDKYNANKTPSFTSRQNHKAMRSFYMSGTPSTLSKYCIHYDLAKIVSSVISNDDKELE